MKGRESPEIKQVTLIVILGAVKFTYAAVTVLAIL